MRARAVVVGAAGVLLPVCMLAYSQRPRQVQLPVYEKPVTFFEEGKQALLVGDLPKGVNSLSAAECGRCHEDQHAQWKDSAHGRATTEPVFLAAFQAEQRFVCRSCHSPLQEQHPKLVHQLRGKPNLLLHGQGGPSEMGIGDHGASTRVAGSVVIEPNTQYSASMATEGVNCAACHVRDGTILTARATGSSRSPHALTYSPQLAKADFCAGCHQFNIQNPSSHPFEQEPRLTSVQDAARLKKALQTGGRAGHGSHFAAKSMESPQPTSSCDNGTDPPICPIPELEFQYQQEPRDQETFDEFKTSPAALRGETCQSCHMPQSNDQAPGHRWPGSENLAMLRKAVSLQARMTRSEVAAGETLETVIDVKNDAGHRFPTGDSIHAGLVDVWLKDGARTLSRKTFVLARQPTPPTSAQGQFPSKPSITTNASAPTDGASLVGPTGHDTRVKAGATARLRFRQKVDRRIAAALNPVVEVRVYYSAVHPGFRGSRIDPKLKPLQLIREELLPVSVRRARVARLN